MKALSSGYPRIQKFLKNLKLNKYLIQAYKIVHNLPKRNNIESCPTDYGKRLHDVLLYNFSHILWFAQKNLCYAFM